MEPLDAEINKSVWCNNIPGDRNSYPLQYSCLENSRDRGAWRATIYGVAKSWTGLSGFHFHYNNIYMV